MLNPQSRSALKRVLASLLGIGQTRLELLGVELAQARQSAVATLTWALVMVLAGALASLMLCAAVVLLAWASYPLLAVLGCALFYVLLAFFAFNKMKSSVDGQGPMFEATITELGKDRQAVLDSISDSRPSTEGVHAP